MKMILLGTGTSHGIPCISCNCRVCTSLDLRDKRLRCSAHVINENSDGTETHLQVDVGPEFRIQAVRSHLSQVDAVFLTHSHADHLHGLDDIRVFAHTLGSDKVTELLKEPENAGVDPKVFSQAFGRAMNLYANKQTIKDVRNRFDYIFKKNTQIGGGKPKLVLVDCEKLKKNTPAEFGEVTVTPVPMKHGELDSTGWLFSVTRKDGVHSIAYLTDCSFIPQSSIDLIKEKGGVIEHCVIDGLRVKPHSTHFGFCQAMDVAEQIKPRHTWFIHICHLMNHVEIEEYACQQLENYPELAKIVKAGGSVGPAWDEMVIEC